MDITKTHIQSDWEVSKPLLSCLFHPSGEFVFSGSEDYCVWRVKVADGTKEQLDCDAWVRALGFADSGNMLITGGYDGKLNFWEDILSTPKIRKSIEAHAGWIRAIAVSPDQSLVASVGNDLVVRLWRTSDGELQHEFRGHESHIYNVCFHPSLPHLVTGDLMGQLIEWNITDGNQIRTWKAESLSKYDNGFRAQIGGFRGLTFGPDGKTLAGSGITKVSNAFAGIGNPSVVVFDYTDVEKMTEYLTKEPLQGVAWNVRLHPDGTIISGCGGSGGSLLFWKPGQTEQVHQLKLPSDVRDLDLSADGKRLSVALANGHLAVCLMDEKSPS
ncbi:hypothetical protein AB1L42_14000 [Thalassoglobus sp. JC818]|uniref:WD40 repeat domain-containing protein n=1 Tax=Thalassoglobus sp. JC818 TaxID=3232136 RepID=UPI0034592B87